MKSTYGRTVVNRNPSKPSPGKPLFPGYPPTLKPLPVIGTNPFQRTDPRAPWEGVTSVPPNYGENIGAFIAPGPNQIPTTNTRRFPWEVGGQSTQKVTVRRSNGPRVFTTTEFRSRLMK